MANKKTNVAIIYDTWYDQMKDLINAGQEEVAYKYMMAILDTQFIGIRDESDPIVGALMRAADFSLNRSSANYAASKFGGMKAAHNRKYPYALLYQLKKYHELDKDDICGMVGCGERTISNAVKEIEKEIQEGAAIEELMQSEQTEAKYSEIYAKYFAFLKDKLLK